MSNIDKHAVQAVADLKAGYTLGHADVAILNELARIALASLEAEPVCVIDQANLDYLKSGSDADVWPASRAEMGDVLLYRSATPAPVSVPDEATPENIEILASTYAPRGITYQWDRDECNAAADSWNACRAAMLKAGHVTAKCPKCGDTGLADSGGVQPWGEPISVACDCTITAAPEQGV